MSNTHNILETWRNFIRTAYALISTQKKYFWFTVSFINIIKNWHFASNFQTCVFRKLIRNNYSKSVRTHAWAADSYWPPRRQVRRSGTDVRNRWEQLFERIRGRHSIFTHDLMDMELLLRIESKKYYRDVRVSELDEIRFNCVFDEWVLFF